MSWDILIVSCEHGDLLASMLHTAGYRAEHAKTVETAWDELHLTPVALVMTDYLVPSVDGCELVIMMRAREALAKMPVLMVTALREEVVRAKCEFDAFLPKPFTEAQLLSKVRQILGPPGTAWDCQHPWTA
jgi:DNA-binding response OmpR family regulator